VPGWVFTPQNHSRVSNINFDFKANEEGGSINIPIATPFSKKKYSNIKVDN
jgi:hypothetical protein